MKAHVTVSLSEIVECTTEEFLDLISERATGTELLMDINYKVTGFSADGRELFMEVTGDDSEVLKCVGKL